MGLFYKWAFSHSLSLFLKLNGHTHCHNKYKFKYMQMYLGNFIHKCAINNLMPDTINLLEIYNFNKYLCSHFLKRNIFFQLLMQLVKGP